MRKEVSENSFIIKQMEQEKINKWTNELNELKTKWKKMKLVDWIW